MKVVHDPKHEDALKIVSFEIPETYDVAALDRIVRERIPYPEPRAKAEHDANQGPYHENLRRALGIAACHAGIRAVGQRIEGAPLWSDGVCWRPHGRITLVEVACLSRISVRIYARQASEIIAARSGWVLPAMVTQVLVAMASSDEFRDYVLDNRRVAALGQASLKDQEEFLVISGGENSRLSLESDPFPPATLFAYAGPR